MDATGRWGWRQVLLLLAVVLGVVLMHSPFAGPHAPAAADELMSIGPMSPTNQDRPATVSHPATVAITGVTALDAAFASPVEANRTGRHAMSAAGHDSMPTGGLHGLMHLCLAVLAGLVVLGLVGFVAFLLYRPARSAAAVLSATVIVPPRPPPRMAVRLAQLCVLRN